MTSAPAGMSVDARSRNAVERCEKRTGEHEAMLSRGRCRLVTAQRRSAWTTRPTRRLPLGNTHLPMSVELRRRIFRQFAAVGAPPELSADELAALAREHVVVLDSRGRIAFANPFATSPAPYTVTTPTRVRFAVCVWDGLGVAAALGEDARVESRCPDCRDPLCLEVRAGDLVPTDTVVHFLVPAGQWYDNLDYT